MNRLLKYCIHTFFSKRVHSDFLLLFAKKEGKELLGKNYKNFWVLLGILFLTFLTIGFSNGSLEYLKKKMSDPFVNWVSVAVPYGRSDNIPNVIADLEIPSNKEKFHIQTISGFHGLITRFASYDSLNTYFFNGRSISFDSPLLSQVLGSKNFVLGQKSFNEQNIGIIVTKQLLDKLNYDGENPFIHMVLTLDSTNSLRIPLPITSIVEELPGLYEYAFTPYFYSQRINASYSNPFRIDKLAKTGLNIFLAGNKLNEQECDSLLKSYMTGNYPELMPMLSLKKDSSKICSGISAKTLFFPEPDEKELNKIFQKLRRSDLLDNLYIYREYAYSFNYAPVDENFHYLSIHFNELSQIREFREYMVDNFELDIDMSLIESKENYGFISRLTRILSVILLAFSVLALTLYSSNVFIRHIEKIKMNLGTFKAFGLDNRLLKRIYLLLIFAFVVGGILISLIMATIVGKLGFVTFLLRVFDYSLDFNYSLFSLQSIWTPIVILIILVSLMVVLVIVTNRLLKKSPGDLIYNR